MASTDAPATPGTPYPDSSSLHVLVIGAGTGGLCLAHGLKRAGVSVAVYEQDRTRVEGPQGFWIGIDPDGSRALHSCLPPETFDTFVATCALPIRHFNMFTEHMSEVLTLEVPPGDDVISSEKSVNRSTLRQVMLTGMDGIVHFGKKFSHYEQHPNGTVTAFFTDGTAATGDVLVGSDGTSSRVRRQYLPQARLEDTGLWGVTGKLPLTDEARALLPQKVIDGVSIFAGPHGDSCVFHVVDLPWDKNGKPKERVDQRSAALLANWSGLYYDGTRDYIMFGFAGAARRMSADMLTFDGDQLMQVVHQRTRNWHPSLRQLFATADTRTCFPLNIRTSVRISDWPPSPVTVLGDAIHTMTPGRGVGANMALRDAALLRDNLVAVQERRMTVQEAVGNYETQMREYAFHAVERSRKRMSAADPVYRPLIGRAVLAGRRIGMRLVNRMPAVKRRMSEREQRFRGAYRAT